MKLIRRRDQQIGSPASKSTSLLLSVIKFKMLLKMAKSEDMIIAVARVKATIDGLL